MDAKKLLARVKYIYRHLPEWLRGELAVDNKLEMVWRGLESRIEALPSTENAGRGTTARLVVSDEHAFHMWAEQNFSAVGPAMDAGGQFISLSTANGPTDFFAQLWAMARQHEDTEWYPIFLPYNLRPGRDLEWYDRQSRTYPREWMIHQEYPRDPDEAFIQTGNTVFDKALLDRHKALCVDPLSREKWPERFASYPEGLKVWARPEDDHVYVAGADVAEGLEHGDYSDLSVFDTFVRPVREVLTLHGHWEPDVFAGLIDGIARLYAGVYGIERNNHGLAVVLECRRLGTPGLYRERAVLNNLGQEIHPGKLGWTTSSTTKPLMIDEWGRALREFSVELRDAMAVPEHVFYKTFPDGSSGAPAGQWDDRVISRALAWQMTKYRAQAVPGLAKSQEPKVFAPIRKMEF